MGLVSARGQGFARYKAAAVPGSFVNSIAFLVQAQSGEILRFDVNTVGTVEGLRGKIFALGEGGNGDLMTCAHCVVVYRGCNTSGVCEGEPYFPSSGRAVVVRMATAPGSTFQIELGRMELGPVDIDAATLHSTPSPGSEGDCIYFENIALNLRGAAGLNCNLGYGCAIADTADVRSPE